MRLLTFSDLHLEHKPDWELPSAFPDFDVCVAAGDIAGSPSESIRLLAAHPPFANKSIVFVAGNHEFYSNVLDDEIEKGLEAAEQTGVHFLNGTSTIIDGVRFVGATLWSDFSLTGDRDRALQKAWRGMNDYRYIRRRAYTQGQSGKWRIQPRDTAWYHARQREAITTILSERFDGETVVVTHHAPSIKSIHSPVTDLDAAYASNVESLMEQFRPALWIHGHVHHSVDYVVGSTLVKSNPKGYGPHELRMRDIQNPDFDPCLIIELPHRPEFEPQGMITP